MQRPAASMKLKVNPCLEPSIPGAINQTSSNIWLIMLQNTNIM